MSRHIVKYEFGILHIPLIKPYELSFTTLRSIDSIWVFIEDNEGRKGIGEATPLPGYGSETLEVALKCIAELGKNLSSLTADSLQQECFAIKSRCPFSVSAVMTALELPLLAAKIRAIKPIPLVFPLSSQSDNVSLQSSVEHGIKLGYKFFKMKVGSNLKNDIGSADQVLRAFSKEDFTVSFDANQAYSFKEALSFCSLLENSPPERVLMLEQPLPSDNWKDMERLCAETSVKLMLDESIYEADDIKQAGDIGCHAVKLKLCKHFGLKRVLELAQKAQELGLHVVIGNGVSTDIGNLGEALVLSSAPDLFSYGAECNGYLKLKNQVVFKDLQCDYNGQLVWHGVETPLNEQLEEIINNFMN